MFFIKDAGSVIAHGAEGDTLFALQYTGTSLIMCYVAISVRESERAAVALSDRDGDDVRLNDGESELSDRFHCMATL